jgi:hypothetical protein
MFKIIGGDGRQYGPVSTEQLRQWIAQGRANTQTLAQAEGSADWKPLGQYPEFAASTPPPLAPPATFQRPPHIPNYLVPAILSTICCCLPFGIVAIVFAAQVNTKLQAGDIQGAMEASQKAKTWFWVAVVLGLLSTLSCVPFLGFRTMRFHRLW